MYKAITATLPIVLPLLLCFMTFKYSISLADASENKADAEVLRTQLDYVAKHRCTISPVSRQWWVCSAPTPHHIFIRDERVHDETSTKTSSDEVS